MILDRGSGGRAGRGGRGKPFPSSHVDEVAVEIGDQVWPQYTSDVPAYRQRLRFDLERLRDLRDLLFSASQATGGRAVLELGSAPFILTGDLVRAGCDVVANGLPVPGAPTSGTVRIAADGRTYAVPLHLFDAEEPFPFADGSFDAVVAGEIFEHLYRQPWKMLTEAHRVLREQGVLVMSTPNGHALEWLYRWWRRNETGMGFNPGAPSVRHAREYGVEEIGELAVSCGFEVIELVTRSYSHIGTDGFPGFSGPAKRAIYGWAKRRAERSRGLLRDRGDTILMVARRGTGPSSFKPPDFMLYALGDPRTGYNF